MTPDVHPTDTLDPALRPKLLGDFTGQEDLCQNLKIFIEAARQRQEALDHVLFYGPPGLGKTTLAHIIAQEMGVGFKTTSGPILSKAGDLAALLTNLQPHDVLFIDEIHRLNPHIEEVLYPAMEDFKLDLMIGEGPAARSIQLKLPPFTLVAATTRTGLMTSPLRDRFGIQLRLSYYTPQALQDILSRNAALLGLEMTREALRELSHRARGTPRIAGRLLRRVRDFAAIAGIFPLTKELAQEALTRLGVDGLGLDQQDRRYLQIMATVYQGGPVGVETLAAALSEQRDTLEDIIEPYLMQLGLIQRTPRGRQLTVLGFEHLGITPLEAARKQAPLF